MKLYEYAVIYNPAPTKDQQDRGDKPKSELIVDVNAARNILARSGCRAPAEGVVA